MLLNTEASSDKILLRQGGFSCIFSRNVANNLFILRFSRFQKIIRLDCLQFNSIYAEVFSSYRRRVMRNNRNSPLLNWGYFLRIFSIALNSSKKREKSFSCRTMQMLLQYLTILSENICLIKSFSFPILFLNSSKKLDYFSLQNHTSFYFARIFIKI